MAGWHYNLQNVSVPQATNNDAIGDARGSFESTKFIMLLIRLAEFIGDDGCKISLINF